MIYKYYFADVVIATLLFSTPAASFAGQPDPLFAADSTLAVRLSAPLTQIMRERSDSDELPGKFVVDVDSNNRAEFDVGVSVRGNFRARKDVCQFAPLRINFRKSQLKDTLLAGQDKIKLVTHCRHGSNNYEQAVLKEYLAYKILNQLTEYSYRVRLLRVSYVSTDDDDRETTHYAFFIESDERLSKRIDMQHREVNAMSTVLLQPDYTNLTSVFQYLIGNLDFSPIVGASDEVCCHNHRLFSAEHDTYWSIPYDFDLSGFVSAPYAQPNPRYHQKSVRQRIYRGRCLNNDRLPATLQLFRERRSGIEALISAQPDLDKSTRKSLESYLRSFYRTIDDERAAEQFAKACI